MADLLVVRQAVILGCAAVFAVVSAVSVIYSVHTSRLLVNEQQGLQREADRLQVEWGQLLLEKSTWGSYSRVEQRARGEIDMYLPSVQEVVVVTP